MKNSNSLEVLEATLEGMESTLEDIGKELLVMLRENEHLYNMIRENEHDYNMTSRLHDDINKTEDRLNIIECDMMHLYQTFNKL